MDFHLLNTLGHLEQTDGVIALPGALDYMLACRPNHPAAINRIQRVTGRGEKGTFVVMGRDIESLKPYAPLVPEAAKALMHTYWPGPLVICLPAPAQKLPWTGDCGLVWLMQPDSTLWMDLLSLQPQGVLLATEAARYQDEPAHNAEAVYNNFGDDVDYVVPEDGLTLRHMPTVVLVDDAGDRRILRSGDIVLD